MDRQWSGHPPTPPIFIINLFIKILLLNFEIKKVIIKWKFFGRYKKNIMGSPK
jgi:hypothetical protein